MLLHCDLEVSGFGGTSGTVLLLPDRPSRRWPSSEFSANGHNYSASNVRVNSFAPVHTLRFWLRKGRGSRMSVSTGDARPIECSSTSGDGNPKMFVTSTVAWGHGQEKCDFAEKRPRGQKKKKKWVLKSTTL